MSAADQAAKLREQADALDAEAKLEEELLAAKQEYRKHPKNDAAKDRHRAASQALAEHRAARRPEGLTVGGDAFVSQASDSGS